MTPQERAAWEAVMRLADALLETPQGVEAGCVVDACDALLAAPEPEGAREVREHLYDYSRQIYHLGAEETAEAAIKAVNEARDSGHKVIVEVSGFGALDFFAIPESGPAPAVRDAALEAP